MLNLSQDGAFSSSSFLRILQQGFAFQPIKEKATRILTVRKMVSEVSENLVQYVCIPRVRSHSHVSANSLSSPLCPQSTALCPEHDRHSMCLWKGDIYNRGLFVQKLKYLNPLFYNLLFNFRVKLSIYYLKHSFLFLGTMPFALPPLILLNQKNKNKQRKNPQH